MAWAGLISLESAVYSSEAMKIECLTATLESMCQGKSACALRVDDALCDVSPDKMMGLIRTLTVVYSCGSKDKYTRSATQPLTLYLACF